MKNAWIVVLMGISAMASSGSVKAETSVASCPDLNFDLTSYQRFQITKTGIIFFRDSDQAKYTISCSTSPGLSSGNPSGIYPPFKVSVNGFSVALSSEEIDDEEKSYFWDAITVTNVKFKDLCGRYLGRVEYTNDRDSLTKVWRSHKIYDERENLIAQIPILDGNTAPESLKLVDETGKKVLLTSERNAGTEDYFGETKNLVLRDPKDLVLYAYVLAYVRWVQIMPPAVSDHP
jgi:hypothetical protein